MNELTLQEIADCFSNRKRQPAHSIVKPSEYYIGELFDMMQKMQDKLTTAETVFWQRLDRIETNISNIEAQLADLKSKNKKKS
jgi:hypothetical protein